MGVGGQSRGKGSVGEGGSHGDPCAISWIGPLGPQKEEKRGW